MDRAHKQQQAQQALKQREKRLRELRELLEEQAEIEAERQKDFEASTKEGRAAKRYSDRADRVDNWLAGTHDRHGNPIDRGETIGVVTAARIEAEIRRREEQLALMERWSKGFSVVEATERTAVDVLRWLLEETIEVTAERRTK